MDAKGIDKIIAAIKQDREFFTSDAQHAKSLDLHPAVYNRIKKGDTERVLQEGKWINLARVLGVTLRDEQQWETVETPVFTYVVTQLEMCRKQCMSNMLCDLPDIGKSHAAKWYAANHPGAVYIDCSQYKSKSRLVRAISKAFGLNYNGKYTDMYDDLVYFIRSADRPMVIIVDEAGDLQYEAFLELKALWNATQNACGWYMIGAVGLAKKIKRGIEREKVGFAEIFSRYGNNCGKCTPEEGAEREKFLEMSIAMVIKANAPAGANVLKLVKGAKNSLRRTSIVINQYLTQHAE